MSWKYDGDGQRVKAFLSGSPSSTTTYYIGNHTEYEIVGQTTTLRRYFYAGSTRVAMRVVDGATNPTYWLLNDHLSSTAITADANGAVTAELRYKAWGEKRFPAGSSAIPTTYRYTGQRQEVQLGGLDGLYFYGSRYYDPALSRFIQPDTLVPSPGDPRAWDRFAYVLNNPLKYIDPTGHTSACGFPWSPPECNDLGGSGNDGDSGGGGSTSGEGSSNLVRPPVVLSNEELQYITVDIMAETSNGGFPAWTFEIHAWVLLNRAARGITYWTGAMNDLMDKGETQFDAAIRWLKNCYLSSAACPVMSAHFNVIFEEVKETYNKYLSGQADPTHGGLFFSHASQLEREGKKFANYGELKSWLTENAEWYKNKHPEWDYYISEPFLYQTYSQAGWRFASNMVIIVTGNEFSGSCTPYSSCGAHR